MQGKKKTEPELLREMDELKRRLAEAKSRETALEQVVWQMRQDCDRCRESLKSCEEHYRLLFETAHDAIILQDSDLFIDCNTRALELFGCHERSELIGHHPAEFSTEVQPDGTNSSTKAQEYICAAMQDQPQKFIWRARRRDGKPLDLEVSLNAFRMGDKQLLQGIARDVSIQRAEERQTKEMLNFLQTLIDTIPSSIFFKDIRGVYQGCNKAYEAFLGLPKEGIVGKTLHEIFPGDLADKYYQKDQELFTNPGKQVYEWQMTSSDGTPHDVIFSKATFEDDDGAVGGLVGVITDITSRKLVEKQLRESEEMFRVMSETAQDAILLMDDEGKITFWNAAAERMFGYTAPEALGRDLHYLLAPERYRDEYERGISYFRTSGQGPAIGQTLEMAAVRKDGAEFPIELSISATRIMGRWSAVGIVRDISERKKALQELRASEEKYRDIVENAVEGIFQCTSDGRFISINSAMARMHGYSSPIEMLEGITNIGEQLFSDSRKWESFRTQIEEQGIIKAFEVCVRCKDGTIIWILINARAVRKGKTNEIYLEGTVEEVTQRKQGELALRRYELLSENTREVILFVGLDGKILEANQAAVLTYGYDREALLSLTLFDLRAPHLREGLKEDLKRTNEKNIFIETEHIRRDGTIFPVEVSAGAVEIGNERMYLSIVRDLTERKKAKQALQESEERYRNIFENAVEGIFQSTPEGRILSANPAQAKIFGYGSSQELIDAFPNIGFGHYVHPVDREKFKEICDTQGTIRNFEAEFYNKNGEIIWISLNARTVRDAEGKILYYEGFAEDITKRKLMERALQDSERLLADIIDFLPDATFVVDTSGRILVWNRAMEEMTDTKAEDMIGKGDYEYSLAFYSERKPMLIDLLSHPDADLESRYAAIEREAGFLTAEGARIVRGLYRVLHGKAAFLYDSEGNIRGAIESLRDITQRKKAEAELQKREQELQIKSQSLEEVNVALKVLLRQREQDKEGLENNILVNIQKMIIPYIEKLKASALPSREASYVGILELLLHDITSPFANKLSAKYLKLTPKEIEIANLVKEGRSTKEIAKIMKCTVRAVEFHRDNIRDKLGLKKSDRNLRSYLLSLS